MKKSLFIIGIIAVLAISTVAFAHGGHFSGNRMNNRGPAGCYGYNNNYNQQKMGSYNNRGMRGQQDMRGMRNQQDMRGMRDQRNMNYKNGRPGMYSQRNEMNGQRNNMTGYRNNSRSYGFENRNQVNMPDNIKNKFEEVKDLRLKMRQGFSSSSPDKEELMSMHQKIQDLNREIADWHFEQRIERFGN